MASRIISAGVELGLEAGTNGQKPEDESRRPASRLSFFLWSSLLDEELLRLAERGKLKDPAALEQQVRRIDNQRAEARIKRWLLNG